MNNSATGVVDATDCNSFTSTWQDSSTGTCDKVISRTWMLTDQCNNQETRVQTVTSIDNTPPYWISIPGSVSLPCNTTYYGPEVTGKVMKK
jgi:hypothetical protein